MKFLWLVFFKKILHYYFQILSKRIKFCFFLVLVFGNFTLFAQTSHGIGTANSNPSAVSDISSTSEGLLVPRMTTLQRNAIAATDDGLLVYDLYIGAFLCGIVSH